MKTSGLLLNQQSRRELIECRMTTGLQTKINPLTSVRFLAAAAVVVSHARPHFACLDNVPDRLVFGQCVSFFFVLAGFILTLVYPAFASGKELSAFLVKRVARLWPLHISVTLLRCLILRRELWTYPGPAPE